MTHKIGGGAALQGIGQEKSSVFEEISLFFLVLISGRELES
jgi:hypothetical protein